jgi:hypothetical protein
MMMVVIFANSAGHRLLRLLLLLMAVGSIPWATTTLGNFVPQGTVVAFKQSTSSIIAQIGTVV